MTETILLNSKAIDDPRNFIFSIWQNHNSHPFYFTSLRLKEGRKENNIRNTLSRTVTDRLSTQVKGLHWYLKERKKKNTTL